MSGTPRILVIDDDANVRKTLTDILRIKGYEAVGAADGAAGIAETQRLSVNVALIDLMLPDMSGIEAMAKIRAQSPLTEVIILTGHASLDSAVEATNKGAFSYLVKPCDVERLLRHIHRALDRQKSQQEILRLASFSQMNPNPVLEVDAAGTLTYLNPAAERVLPGHAVGQPVGGALGDLAVVAGNAERKEVVRELKAGNATFEQHLYPVPGSGRVRIYMMDITERKLREAKIERLNAHLLVLRDINESLLKVDSEQRLFQFVCESLNKFEDIVIAWIVLREPQPKIMPVAWAGVDEADLSKLQVHWDDAEKGIGFIGSSIRQLEPVTIHDAEADARLAAWQDVTRKWKIKSAIAIPIHGEGTVIATLSVFSRRPAAFDEEFVNFLQEVCGNITIGTQTLRLDKNLHATLDHLRRSMNSTVEAIAGIIELRDPYTAGHERRVAQLASAIGREMVLPERQVEGLRVIGFLHDIGKVAVPAEILSKPSRLTSVEFAIVKEHARAGYDLLKSFEFSWPVAQAILQHHERLDGSGYPQGLNGQDIILEARILMVADVVEAMVSHRPYRSAVGLDVAMAEIAAKRGSVYDEGVVDTCIRLFAEKRFDFDGSF